MTRSNLNVSSGSVLAEKYGPWALITGSSDGTGAAFARQLASAGLNVVLIGRREEPLRTLAVELEREHAIQTRVASIDLYLPGAGERVLAVAEGLDIGMFVSNAGADTNASSFLGAPLAAWRELITRNVLTVTEVVYGLAGPMCERARGGIILMSSGAAIGGGPGVVAYSATKAFDLNLGEGLWAELRPRGVDVIVGVAPPMDTPTLHSSLGERAGAIPGLVEPAEVVRTLIEGLGSRPVHIFPFGFDAPRAAAMQAERRERVEHLLEAVKMFFGDL